MGEAKRIAAEAGIEEIERAAQVGRLSAKAVGLMLSGRNVTISSAIDDWQIWMGTQGLSPTTIHLYVGFMKRWIRDSFMSSTPVASVQEFDLSQELSRGTVKLSTRRAKLAAFHNLFKFCSAKGWSLGDPSKLVKINWDELTHEQKETKVAQVWTDGEIEKVLEQARRVNSIFWESAVLIARYTGLRLGDIARLEWACLDRPGYLIVWTDKRNKRVELPLEPERLRWAFDRLLRPTNPEIRHIFPMEAQQISDLNRRATLSFDFAYLASKAGIKKNFHGLRHTYITEQHRLGKSIEHIRRAVGHQNHWMTRHYIHPQNATPRETNLKLLIVPDGVRAAISQKLDLALKDFPEGEQDRSELFRELLEYWLKAGAIPDFEVQRRNSDEAHD